MGESFTVGNKPVCTLPWRAAISFLWWVLKKPALSLGRHTLYMLRLFSAQFKRVCNKYNQYLFLQDTQKLKRPMENDLPTGTYEDI